MVYLCDYDENVLYIDELTTNKDYRMATNTTYQEIDIVKPLWYHLGRSD